MVYFQVMLDHCISKKVTGLKGGKMYYVKVRTYKKIGSTKYYSKWSNIKSATTRK